MSFADRLREERRAAGLTVSALARLAGVDEKLVRIYESSQANPVNGGASRIAGALGLDIVDLTSPLFEVVVVTSDAAAMLAEIEDKAEGHRVLAWPMGDDGHLRMRVSLGALPAVVAASPNAPSIAPVRPSACLDVLVDARHKGAAERVVLSATTKVECCPPISLQRVGTRWLARLKSVPARCSLELQRLTPRVPIGLFVPGV